MRTFVTALMLTLAAAVVHSATLNVPGDYATIQAAIDAASNGDIVEVSDGVYTGAGNIEIDLSGKRITVRSANGPKVTIIDC